MRTHTRRLLSGFQRTDSCLYVVCLRAIPGNLRGRYDKIRQAIRETATELH